MRWWWREIHNFTTFFRLITFFFSCPFEIRRLEALLRVRIFLQRDCVAFAGSVEGYNISEFPIQVLRHDQVLDLDSTSFFKL